MTKADFLLLLIVALFIGGIVAILFAGALQLYGLFGWGLLAMLSVFPIGFLGLAIVEGDA